jgi:hypothetical protein
LGLKFFRNLLEICGELNDLVPLAVKDCRRLDDFHTVKERIQSYTRLRAAEAFNQIVRSVEIHEEDIFSNSAVKVYKSLGCSIERLQYKDERFKTIGDSLTTHGHTHTGWRLCLREVFEVQKPGEIEKFFPFGKLQRKMLWHGAKPSQLLYTLKNGL